MMAAKDVKMATDNLGCPVCYQLFRNPKYLPCHHSYCEQCLEKIQVQSKIICPECRKEAIVPPGGVKDLDSNYFINHLVDKFILKCKVEGEAEVKCDECRGEDPIVAFCPDCNLFLCHFCNEYHKRSNKFRGHGIVPLTELRSKKDVAIRPKPKAMMCREHDIELLFYCETCDQLLCMYCTVKYHIGHNLDTVKKVVGKHRQELKKITAPVEEMIRGLSDTHDNIEKMRNKIRQQDDEVNKKIDRHYDEVIQKLMEQKEQLKQQVHDTVSQKVKAVTTQLEEVEYAQADVLSVKELNDAVEKSSDQEVLSVKKQVIDRMQHITDKYRKVNLPPVQQATMEFVPTKEAFPKFGLVCSVDPPNCKVSIPKYGIKGRKTEFTTITKLNNGSRGGSQENKKDALPAKQNTTGAAVVIHVNGPHQISCDGESGGYFVWKDCGLKINFPPKCLQHYIQITTNTFLPIKNEVYPGIHIVSAVYQFNCNIERFDKEFTLHLQHCVKLQSPEDCQKMRFMILQDDSNDVKYGHFEVGNRYGTIQLDRFCYIFIIWIDELWKNIHLIVLPLSNDQDSSSQQIPSNQSSNSGMQAELPDPPADQGESSQSPEEMQQIPSESSLSLSVVGINHATSPPCMYEAMIGLPKDHCGLTEWSSIYSIYDNLETWRNVCKESIQIEEVISNFSINFYAGEIEFDADGVAKITCEKTQGANVVVECRPNQITKEDVIRVREDYIDKCRIYPLSARYKNIVRNMVQKSHIHVTKMSDTQPSNCQLAVKGIEPQQMVDLCANHYTNLTLIDIVDSQSTSRSNTGPIKIASSGLMASDIHIDISPRLKQSGALDKKPKMKDVIIIGLIPLLAAKWETVAYLLDYDTPKINIIKTSKRENPENCCQELLRNWLEENHDDAPKTWFTLLNTIAEDKTFTRSIENVLENLEKKYVVG